MVVDEEATSIEFAQAREDKMETGHGSMYEGYRQGDKGLGNHSCALWGLHRCLAIQKFDDKCLKQSLFTQHQNF